MARKPRVNCSTCYGILATRIRELLKFNKMTREELGLQIDVSGPAVSQFQSGKNAPKLDTLIKIANVFNTTTDYLLGLSDVTRPDAPDITIQQIANYTGLSKEQIAFLAENRLTEEDKVLVWEFMQLLARKNAALEAGTLHHSAERTKE